MARTNAEIIAALAAEIIHTDALHTRGTIDGNEWVGRDLALRNVARHLGLSARALREAEHALIAANRK